MDGESHLGLCPKGPRYSEPRAIRLAINSLLQQSFQVYVALKCLTFITVMKWVKRMFECSKARGAAIVLTSSPPPPNPKSTLPPISHSPHPAPGKTDQWVIREGRQWRKRTSISSHDRPFNSQITYVTAWTRLRKLTQGSAPYKPKCKRSEWPLVYYIALCLSRTETFCIRLTHRLDAYRSTSLKAVSQDDKRHVCVCQG